MKLVIDISEDYYETLKEMSDESLLMDTTIIKYGKPLPKPKTGHWINYGAIPSSLGDYRWCSNCNCGIDAMEFHRNHYNYCPDCGAKMLESEGEG